MHFISIHEEDLRIQEQFALHNYEQFYVAKLRTGARLVKGNKDNNKMCLY